MNCRIGRVYTALVYLQRTACSFAFSSSSTGRLKWVLMSSVIVELIRLFGQHLWAAVFQIFPAILCWSSYFQARLVLMQKERRRRTKSSGETELPGSGPSFENNLIFCDLTKVFFLTTLCHRIYSVTS